MITRRNFLKNTALGIAGAALPLAALEIVDPKKLFAQVAAETTSVRWVFLVDTYKCVGCGLCVKACKQENEVPYDANVTRTWVERYVLTKKGKMYADTPKGSARRFHDREDRPRTRTGSRTSAVRASKRRSLCRSSATSAKILRASRCVLWGPRTRLRTASCWSTGPGASVAGIASWAVRTACGSSTRYIIRQRNAISAITGSPRA